MCYNIFRMDKDPSMVNACHLEINTRHKKQADCVTIQNKDYLPAGDVEKVSFLVCNLSYINFHNFDRNLITKIRCDLGVKFSMLTNMYTQLWSRQSTP